MVTTWNTEIDPTWEGAYANLYNPEVDNFQFEPGDYIVRVYIGNEVASEGEFHITPAKGGQPL